MKGIELPISTIVVIIVVLVVLLAVISLFYGVWPMNVGAVNLESAKDNACNMLIQKNGCTNDVHSDITKSITINGFDADRDESNVPGIATVNTGDISADCKVASGAQDNLFMLCHCWYNINVARDDQLNDDCKAQVCGCS